MLLVTIITHHILSNIAAIAVNVIICIRQWIVVGRRGAADLGYKLLHRLATK